MDAQRCPYHNSGINLSIRDSHFTSSNGLNLTLTQAQPSYAPIEDALSLLMTHVALGALSNSNDRFDPPKCHPNTRVAILDGIDRWAHGHGDQRPILWLRGPLGAGKSAIAQTLAERWEEKLKPVATFFLSRTAVQRNQKQSIIPTIAYQLTLSIPEIRPFIGRAIMRDKGLFGKDLRTQIMELVIRPLSFLDLNATNPIKVVIDGLDECCQDLRGQNYEEQQREILEAIAFAARQDELPLRFLVGSRPERQIVASFNRKPLCDLTQSVVLDNSHNPKADIRLYLSCKFEEIRQGHPYIDASWPSEAVLSGLLEKSSGHFIYAAVVVRQLEEPRRDPRETLASIRNLNVIPRHNSDASPFAELDALYLHIMGRISTRSLPIVTGILELLCFRQKTWTEVFWAWEYCSPASIEKYLFISQGQVYIHLADLHSVLEVPPYSSSTTAPVRFIHASFVEFLTNRFRSGQFFIHKSQALLHLQLTRLRHCFEQTFEASGPDFEDGDRLGYKFRAELIHGLRSPRLRPSRELAEGLAILFGSDDAKFLHYVRSHQKLSHLEVRSEMANVMYRDNLLEDERDVKVLCNYIERSGIDFPNAHLEDDR